MSKRNGVNSSKLQLTVDENTERIISEMIHLGIHGANKAEVATWIIREWIWSNQNLLANSGISIMPPRE